MHDGGAHLRLDVVAHDRQFGVSEPLRPLFVACDENRHAVHESAACFQSSLRIVSRGFLRPHRQIRHQHISLRRLQLGRHIANSLCRLFYDIAQIRAEAVQSGAALDDRAGHRHFAEAIGVVLAREYRLGYVDSYFVGIHIKGCHEVHIADVIAAQDGMHDAGHFGIFGNALVILHALNERRSAIAHADDGHIDLFSACAHET